MGDCIVHHHLDSSFSLTLPGENITKQRDSDEQCSHMEEQSTSLLEGQCICPSIPSQLEREERAAEEPWQTCLSYTGSRIALSSLMKMY
jgi:hypothetical protein